MKRYIIIILAVAASAAAAQGWGPGPRGQEIQADSAELTRIEGRLTLVKAHPAVVVNNKTYFVQIPGRLYGFVDGLREGAQVRLEGFERALPYTDDVVLFRVVKLTLGGREIDLSRAAGLRGWMQDCPGVDRGPRGRGMMQGRRGW